MGVAAGDAIAARFERPKYLGIQIQVAFLKHFVRRVAVGDRSCAPVFQGKVGEIQSALIATRSRSIA